ncbi:hypothetical protein FIBSPDRAFT_876168 [Athelia psychrophila]|uniref:Uncharacterized protein n=1 Tax=Athelia psychrophila TaxID=1759441 RepID=A0A167X525_9AGAM|nr:hypothetical protein FIBSPDRAFT_876168 [Fibularhizoctonia sp. CBS 109695]
MAIALRTFADPTSSFSNVTPFTDVAQITNSTPNTDASIPLPGCVQIETFSVGWIRRRSIRLVEIVRESGKIREAMKALVALQV